MENHSVNDDEDYEVCADAIYLHHEDLLLDDGEIISRLKLDHL